MDLVNAIGFTPELNPDSAASERQRRSRYVALKLIANGLPCPDLPDADAQAIDAERLLGSYHHRLKQLDPARCAADMRIESFLHSHFQHVGGGPLRLPDRTVVLDRHGLARELSLPLDGDTYSNDQVSSFRVRNGVLHNPQHDRRTTSGTFHVCEGGLPIPADKQSVPQTAFAELFRRALDPPAESLELPYTANCEEPARSFVSLLLRPLVCPAVEGFCSEKRMEIRFFAPGSLIANLDFVESIFGNAGDAFLPENDAGLDVEHWTGHTGCVILAPHLTQVTKREVGLPQRADATPRQIADGMCWESEDELYNGGTPFKLTCRSDAGVIVTLIADNYFGYCKKEVKTQISYATNLYGNVEEEHAGGAIAFASFNLGDDFNADSRRYNNRTFADVATDYATLIDVKPEGYGIDRELPDLIYIPENARASVRDQSVTWQRNGAPQSIPLLPEKTYMTPSGYRLRLTQHPAAPTWRLIGTMYEGVCCHKPCTVSGGGKSEISKTLTDYVLHGPIFVSDLEDDFAQVQKIFDREYSDRWRPDGRFRPDYSTQQARHILDPGRSLGSVIKLLTPSLDYTDEYNAWLDSIPGHIYALVFAIKRFHRGGPDANWREPFRVDIVNGDSGHELKFRNRSLVGDYLRVGLLSGNTWRTYKLRQDFEAAEKTQIEDDISVSVVVPARRLESIGTATAPACSYKFVENCEFRLFQRPDDAVHRGLDKQSEADLSREDNFIVNFEPLSHQQVVEVCNRPVDLSEFTAPMQRLMKSVAELKDEYVVCSATPRMIDGKPSRNPRYLQNRPDLMNPTRRVIAERGIRLYRAVPIDKPVHIPVHAVLLGRRNNPPDYARGIRPLAVYNPIHYQEPPELFMDFISSLTGKSPSTTGAGSEGALTKGPFNALLPIADLNNALVSFLLTGLDGFSSSAGHIGPNIQVDHDISLLIPEIWCRLSPEERDPRFLIAEGLLEKIHDDIIPGEDIPASRLGYRMTSRFVRRFLGRIFDNPSKVFDEAMLKPETQDPIAFADGVRYIVEAHERVARQYFEDGGVEQACPPLRALLHIMAEGSYEGLGLNDPELRGMFTRDAMLTADWYRERLETKQRRDTVLWQRHVDYLEQALADPMRSGDALQLNLDARAELARNELRRVSSPEYLTELNGCLGADPMMASAE